jgi:hypothetical protein
MPSSGRMAVLFKCLSAGCIGAVAVSGQTLHIPPSGAGRKIPAAFEITLDSPHDRAPVALQWEFSVPAVVAVHTADIAIGKAAQSAGKSLTCAARASSPASPEQVRYICILAGGQNLIRTGPIAVVHYRARGDVQRAPIRVVITNVLGVSADLKRIDIPNADAVIHVR